MSFPQKKVYRVQRTKHLSFLIKKTQHNTLWLPATNQAEVADGLIVQVNPEKRKRPTVLHVIQLV
jgi:hypothetical protein